MEIKKYMFTAKWCGNCVVMKPIAKEIEGIEIIDVDENPELAEKYSIMSLPTFILDDGEVKAIYGSMPKQLLEEFYENRKVYKP